MRTLSTILITCLLTLLSTGIIHAQDPPIENPQLNPQLMGGGPEHRIFQSTGKFIIKPDVEGRLDFDTTVAWHLQYTIDSIRSIYNIKGISAAVLIPAKGIWIGASGFSTISPPDSIRPDMLFGIGSQTKSFISTLILQLAGEGRLSIDDTIGLYLPPYPNISSAITIRQLLNMTSGLFDIGESWALARSVEMHPRQYWPPEKILTTFVEPPYTDPGVEWQYSNTNYTLLAMIIEAITDTSIAKHLHRRIFEPLGLHNIFFPIEDSLAGPVAHPWTSQDNISLMDTAEFSMSFGCAGMFSTAENCVRWASALFGGEVLGPIQQAQMFTLVPTGAFSGAGAYDGRVWTWHIQGFIGGEIVVDQCGRTTWLSYHECIRSRHRYMCCTSA